MGSLLWLCLGLSHAWHGSHSLLCRLWYVCWCPEHKVAAGMKNSSCMKPGVRLRGCGRTLQLSLSKRRLLMRSLHVLHHLHPKWTGQPPCLPRRISQSPTPHPCKLHHLTTRRTMSCNISILAGAMSRSMMAAIDSWCWYAEMLI